MPVEIEAVTFDVGHTVLTPYPSVGQAYEQICALAGVTVEGKKAQQYFGQCWTLHRQKAIENGTLIYGMSHAEGREFWGKVLHDLFELMPEVEIDKQEELIDLLYEVFSRPAYWRIVKGFKGAIEKCRSHGLKVGFLSNWDIRLRSLLEKMNLIEMVDFVVISAEAGLEKPNKKIFDYAAKLANAQVEKMIHVGDSREDDIDGALNAGFAAAFWFNQFENKQMLGESIHENVKIFSDYSKFSQGLDEIIKKNPV